MATLKEMRDRVLDATGRPPGAHAGEATRLVNDAYLFVVEKSRLNTKTVVLNLTLGQGDYSLADDFGLTDVVAPRTLAYTMQGDSSALLLQPVSFDTLANYRAAVQSVSGTGQAYAFWGIDNLSIWPSPDTADTLALTYDYRPDPLALDEDTPDAIPLEYHYVIEDCAIARSARYKPALKDLATEANARYQQGLMELLRHRNKRQGAMPRAAVIGQRRHILRRGNSVSYLGDA